MAEPSPSSATTIGFAGAGWIVAIHGMAAATFDDVEVGPVASREPANAALRATQAGGHPVAYDDLPAGADAVVVATPPTLHRRETERAVDGGAAVLVETPLAASLADADALVARAAAGAPHIAYGENLVHSPVLAEAVSACRRMGQVTHLEVRFAQGRPEGGAERMSPAWGGGAGFDLGIHALALAVLMAAPARVTSVQTQLLRSDDLEVDDDAAMALSFDTGLTAHVRATWRAAAPVWDAQAASATSAVRVELVPEPSVELNGAPLRLPSPPDGLPSEQLHHLGYLAQIGALGADTAAGLAPRVDVAFGRLLLDIVCAAYTSARTGAAEPVPFTGPRDRTPHQLWTDADRDEPAATHVAPATEAPVPEAPATNAPAVAGTRAPAAPATDTPADPGTEPPASPGTDTHTSPATDAPADPGTDAPAGTDTPASPATDAPADPGTDAPADA